jgi:hypothetical protein
VLSPLWCFFRSATTIGWATFTAEVLVAAAIYFELEQGRTTRFIEAATREQADDDRRAIYTEFLSITEFPSLEDRSREFVRRMLETAVEPANNPDPGHVSLKLRCDRQIALFNNLGITIAKWYAQKQQLVEVFPHAAIYMWIILNPYIIQRRSDTGPWLARPLLTFTQRCVTFVLKTNLDRGLHLRRTNGTEGLSITRDHLVKTQRQLAHLLDEPFMPGIES